MDRYLKYLLLGLYRHEGKAFRDDIDAVMRGQVLGVNSEEAAAQVTAVILLHMYAVFVSQSDMETVKLADRLLKPLLVEAEQLEGHGAKQETEDSDDEYSDDELEPAHAKIVVARASRLSQKFAAIRFMLQCFVIVAFEHQQDYTNRLDFIAAHASCEFARNVGSYLGMMRTMGEVAAAERDSITVRHPISRIGVCAGRGPFRAGALQGKV